MSKDERGGIYLTALIIALIAIIVIIGTTAIYLSEYGFIVEIRDYYQTQIKQLLLERKYPGLE